MGLDTTHGCWHGAYSAFMRWRIAVAKAVGISDLFTMEGYGGETQWDESDPITLLLRHSDCDGLIESKDCEPLAKRLEEIMPDIASGAGNERGEYHRGTAQQFANGLRDAAAKGENIEFY